MRFTDALSVLSKSSSYAVSTEHDLNQDLVKVKSQLYVTMPIEHDFLMKLEKLKEGSKKVLFLCGSSGDGKSEILLRALNKFDGNNVKFHLDATHSFSPKDSAIQTLNQLFADYFNGSHSLVIGINIGMLGNYAEEAENIKLREVLKKYLDNKESNTEFEFINFENYPKFEITKDGYKSDFVSQLLKKVTDKNSMLYKAFINEEVEGLKSINHFKFVNYKLLCQEGVQQVIIELLLKVRLFRNQFITARTFLDFIFEIISRNGYLFDNLFNCNDNEILEKLIEFDPALLRTKSIDRFLISHALEHYDTEFSKFKLNLSDEMMIRNLDCTNSYIRLFYLLKNCVVGNNYHSKFEDDFSEDLLRAYLNVYRHHKFYDVKNSKPVLRDFYNKELFSALRSYINKKAPYLEEDQYLIAEHDEYQLISHLKLSPHLLAIESSNQISGNGSFEVYIKIKDNENMNFAIDINLFELLNKLKAGYRPNKNDHSVVIIFNEIVNRLVKLANKSSQINFNYNAGEIRFTLEDDYIEVGGMR